MAEVLPLKRRGLYLGICDIVWSFGYLFVSSKLTTVNSKRLTQFFSALISAWCVLKRPYDDRNERYGHEISILENDIRNSRRFEFNSRLCDCFVGGKSKIFLAHKEILLGTADAEAILRY